jgi:iron complex outermembrane receptor protein
MNTVRATLPLAAVAAFVPCASGLAGTTTSAARSETPAVRTAVLEEIVVTARRREERLLDVPIAVSAFDELQIERLQLEDLDTLQYAVPTMVVAHDQTNRSTAVIALRGQVEVDSVPTVDPAVGVYLDGVYIARATGANLRFIDMERVEVLRGPQGTLYGRNTVGGAINLVPNRPSSRLESRFDVALGNYDRRDITAVLNLPFAQASHALRITAAHTEHGGYAKSTLLERELNDDDTDFARVQIALAPAERWHVSFLLDYTRFENSGQLRTLAAATPAATGVTAASGNPGDSIMGYVDGLDATVPANRVGSVESTVAGAATVVTFDGPWATLKSITAGRWLDSVAREVDQDGTPYDLGAILLRREDQRQVSQEFQLYGHALGSRLEWIAGLYGFEEQGTFEQEALSYIPATRNWNVNLPSGSFDSDAIAAYGQIDYAVAERLRVAAGLRFNEDGRQLTSRNAVRVAGDERCRLAPDLRDAPGTCRATLPEREFLYTQYMLGVEFEPRADALLYAKANRGHRAGGYNIRGASAVDLDTFDPEHVTTYEVGAKADLLERRLRVDLAVFRTLYDDIQLFKVLIEGGPGIPFVDNGGSARIDGLELELAALLGPLRVSSSLGLLRPRYTQLDPDVADVTLDSEFLHTPDATFAVAADLPVATDFGVIDLHVDYGWRDDVAFSYDPQSPARQPAYGLWNARIAARPAHGGWEFGLWGRNLSDTRYFTRLVDGFYVSAAVGDPRTYGVFATYRWGER